jgi:hypothetical protein
LLVAAMGLRYVAVAVSQLDCAQGTQDYVYPQLQQLLVVADLMIYGASNQGSP